MNTRHSICVKNHTKRSHSHSPPLDLPPPSLPRLNIRSLACHLILNQRPSNPIRTQRHWNRSGGNYGDMFQSDKGIPFDRWFCAQNILGGWVGGCMCVCVRGKSRRTAPTFFYCVQCDSALFVGPAIQKYIEPSRVATTAKTSNTSYVGRRRWWSLMNCSLVNATWRCMRRKLGRALSFLCKHRTSYERAGGGATRTSVSNLLVPRPPVLVRLANLMLCSIVVS